MAKLKLFSRADKKALKKLNDETAPSFVPGEKPQPARMVTVPKFIDSIGRLCTMADMQRFPFPFIKDFKVCPWDIIIVGVHISDISTAMVEMRDYEVDKDWLQANLKHRNMLTTEFMFAFQYGPYIFLVQTRFDDPYQLR